MSKTWCYRDHTTNDAVTSLEGGSEIFPRIGKAPFCGAPGVVQPNDGNHIRTTSDVKSTAPIGAKNTGMTTKGGYIIPVKVDWWSINITSHIICDDDATIMLPDFKRLLQPFTPLMSKQLSKLQVLLSN
jgi:hypothetical protein